MNTFYRIGKLIIELNYNRREQFISRLHPFICSSDQADIVYNRKQVRHLAFPMGNAPIYMEDTLAVFKGSKVTQFYHMIDGVPYALTEECQDGNFVISTFDDVKEYNVHPYFWMDLMHLERGLIKKDCIVLHAAYIETEGKAVLFTAQSGGGKTTQAELWKKYKNARIINGDKCIVGKENGEWRVYGIPFSGSSQDCLNEVWPLKAVVAVEKYRENIPERIDQRGFSKILSQTILNSWDQEYMEKCTDRIIELCSEVPVYQYFCTKDSAAADVLYEELF